jgi:hypothetical protein
MLVGAACHNSHEFVAYLQKLALQGQADSGPPLTRRHVQQDTQYSPSRNKRCAKLSCGWSLVGVVGQRHDGFMMKTLVQCPAPNNPDSVAFYRVSCKTSRMEC